ncbi:MAG TPA: RidA family protein [Allosphingosinicella sp.]|jgi:reactive intermediate/imine deaminase
MPRILAAASIATLLAGCAAASAERQPLQHYPAGSIGSLRLPFSAAVRAGDVLYLSGQIGTRADGTLPDGIEAQSRQTMDNIAAVLARAGLGWGDVFRCLVMIDDMSQWQAFNRIYVTYFEEGRLPARSALGADGLALGALVEVECQAYAPGRGTGA